MDICRIFLVTERRSEFFNEPMLGDVSSNVSVTELDCFLLRFFDLTTGCLSLPLFDLASDCWWFELTAAIDCFSLSSFDLPEARLCFNNGLRSMVDDYSADESTAETGCLSLPFFDLLGTRL